MTIPTDDYNKIVKWVMDNAYSLEGREEMDSKKQTKAVIDSVHLLIFLETLVEESK